jgi:exportin-T
VSGQFLLLILEWEFSSNRVYSLVVLRNKLSHTVTLFFLCTYNEQWPTFFSDIFTLLRPAEQHSRLRFNRHVSLLFFHIVLEISGEVADQIIKSARTFLATRHARDGRVRDGVRERDAARINEAVLAIVAEGAERMNELRKSSTMDSQTRVDLDHAIEVVDWGVRTFGSYVGMSFLVSIIRVTLKRKL